MSQNELQRLLPRHFRILDLCLLGWSQKNIATEVGMTPTGIGLIVNSPRFQDELARRREAKGRQTDEVETISLGNATRKLEDAAEDAASVQVTLLKDEDHRVQLSASNSILDRVLAKKGEAGPSIVLTMESINILALSMEETKEMPREEVLERESTLGPVKDADA